MIDLDFLSRERSATSNFVYVSDIHVFTFMLRNINMAIVPANTPYDQIHSLFSHETEVDLVRWWGANTPRHPFEWKLSKTRKLDFGPIASVMEPSRIEVDEIVCDGFRYDGSRFIRNVTCDNFHVKSELMKTPCLLTRLDCNVVYVTLTEFIDYDDAVKMAKDWLNAIPVFTGKELAFSMRARMLMENKGQWFARTGQSLPSLRRC